MRMWKKRTGTLDFLTIFHHSVLELGKKIHIYMSKYPLKMISWKFMLNKIIFQILAEVWSFVFLSDLWHFFNVNFSDTFVYHFQNFIKIVIIIAELSNLVFKLIRQRGIQISSHIKCKMCWEEVVVPYTTSTNFINNICILTNTVISLGV